MKTKKWNRVTVISLVAIVAEIVLLFVLAIPAMKSNKLFKYLEAGSEKKAANVYEELSNGQQKKVQKKLDDFGTYQVNQYIEGNKTYDEVSDSLYAAANLDSKKTPDIMEEYIEKAASIELVKLYETAVQDYIENEDYYTDVFEDCEDEFTTIWYDLDSTDVADEELYNYLNAKYDDYKAGNVDADTMNMYSKVGYYLFEYGTDSCNLASDINSDMYYVMMYQSDYEEAQSYYDDEDYFSCVEMCDDELNWNFYDEDDTTGYMEKFQSLRDDAYETGKTYYLSQAEDMINGGDTDGGKDLLKQIENFYGEDIDTSAVWELTRGAWMTPYVEFMDNWEENLRNDVAGAAAIGTYDDPKTLDMDEYLPDEIYLYDIDGNGTPELMLQGDDYTYFIYTYDGSKVVFTGAIRIAAIADTSKVIAEPISMPDDYVQGYELLTFANNTWTVDEYYVTDGENFEVNGETSTYEAAEEMHNRFEDMQQSVSLDYSYIDYYEDFIYSYGE